MIDLTKVLTLAFPDAEVMPWPKPTHGRLRLMRGTLFGEGIVSLRYNDLTGLYTARFEPQYSRNPWVSDGETPEIAVDQLFEAEAERLRGLSRSVSSAGREAWARMTKDAV